MGDLTDLQCCRSRRVGCHGLLLYKSYARVLARYFVCRIDQKNTQEKKECIDTFCWVTVDTLTDFPARHLLVLSIEEGTVQEYNTKNPENAVQEGDHIVSVNGSSQDTEMVISADFIGSRKLHSCVLLRIKENGCPSWKIDRSDKRPWA